MIALSSSMTIHGDLPKDWYVSTDGKILLIKGNHVIDGNPSYEPYSEVIASIVGRHLGLNCVEYTLGEIPGYSRGIPHVSICEKFQVPTGYQRMTADAFMHYRYGKPVTHDKYLDFYLKSGAPVDDFIKMLIFDAVIGNRDRHTNNWELAIGPNDEVISLPLIDHGSSLLADRLECIYSGIGPDDAKPFSKTHTKQLSRIKVLYPYFKWVVPTDELWEDIYRDITPTLSLMPPIRAVAVCTYLHNRFTHYLSMFQ